MMKCCDNCLFFIDENKASQIRCNWWLTRISLPTSECVCTKWVYVNDSETGDKNENKEN